MSATLTPYRGLGRSALAVLAGLAVSLLIIVAVSDDPLEAFRAFTVGSFENVFSFGSMVSLATVLAFTGLASAVAFRAGAFNIGGEGQLYLGALASAVVALELAAPPVVVMALALLAAIAAGTLWILVPALLRAFAGVSEIVTTLMASYIATLLTLYLVNAHLRDPESGAPETRRLDRDVWLPQILSPSKASVAVFLAIALAAVFHVLVTRTRLGMRVKLVGLQPTFAETVGIAPDRILLLGLLASGALAGLAGGIITLSIEHRFIQSFSPGYGFLGITVALIGRLSPAGVLASAFLYGTLLNGATKMQTASDVPFALVFILQGVLILLITSQGIRRRRGRTVAA